MEIRSTVDKNTIVLEVSGAIDGSTAPDLRQAITEAVQPGRQILLDMHKVHFMSSAGLRVMLLLHRQLQQHDSKVVLVGLLDPIYDAMEATGFLKYFDTAADLDAARQILEA